MCDNWQRVFHITVEEFCRTILCRITLIQPHWYGGPAHYYYYYYWGDVCESSGSPQFTVKASQSDFSPDFN